MNQKRLVTQPENPAARFFRKLETDRYPQPVVGGASGVSLSDLNAWRKRNIIVAQVTENPRKVTYSGRDVLTLAFIGEAAWLIGPTRAAEMAVGLSDYIGELRDALVKARLPPTAIPFDFGEAARTLVVIERPAGASYESAQPYRLDNRSGDNLADLIGLPWQMVGSRTLAVSDYGRAFAIIPVGRIFIAAAWRAARLLGDGEAAR